MGWIKRDTLIRKLAQSSAKLCHIAHAHSIAEVLSKLWSDFLRRDEQLCRAVLVSDHIGQGDRRIGHISPAHIEQPCDRIKRADHACIIGIFSQPFGQFCALICARLAGMLIQMRDRDGRGRGRAISPKRINRVGFYCDQFCAFGSQSLRQSLNPANRVEPCVIANSHALFGMAGEPLRSAGLRHVFIVIKLAINLIAYLHRIAAIGEDRCAIAFIALGQNRRIASAAAKTG